MELIGVLLLITVAIAIAALIGGIVFSLLWNDFVVNHVHGAHRVSFFAAVLVAWGIAILTQSSSAASKS